MTDLSFVTGSVRVVQTNITQPFRLLVVDDIEDNRILLSRRFSKCGYLVVGAASGVAALDLVARQQFDLVLLDVMMPGLSGIDVLRQIRAGHSPDTLPVIMITAKAGSLDVVEALELGANDYITKPVDFSVAFARAQTQLTRKQSKQALERSLRELETTNRRLELEIAERKRSDAQVHHLRYHDALTSLGNREQFHAQLSRELQLRHRNGGCVAVMIFDLDDFKRINSTLGDAAGDLLLINVATRLRHCLREVDSVARLGSDEFGVIATVAGPERADQLAGRITAAIAEPHTVGDQQVTLASSAGIALAPIDGTEPESLMRNAQLALIAQGRKGRQAAASSRPT